MQIMSDSCKFWLLLSQSPLALSPTPLARRSVLILSLALIIIVPGSNIEDEPVPEDGLAPDDSTGIFF